jgi:NAD(P)-dependent dehydrogenase (short-subunit alcohol dehydrogenase family)
MTWADMRERNMSLDLAGVRVLVTGAGSGIGFALARHAARAGARVAIVDIRREKADAAAAELAAAGADARGYGCDVTQPADVERLRAAVAADLGGIDMLFNNAGIGVPGKIDEISATDVDWTLAVNVGGITNCVRAFAPALRASAAEGRDAWIVNTGSEHSLGIPTMGANNIYTASKHAVLGLSDVMRSDLGPDGIRIAVLCPGLVSTNLYDAGRARPDTFGGAFSIPEEHRSHAIEFMKTGQDPALTAQICFEGIDRGDFIIIADPNTRAFAEKRINEIRHALDAVEARLRSEGS